MTTAVLHFLIVGHNDQPIFEADLAPKPGDASAREDRTQYLYQFVMHAALDSIEEQEWAGGTMHLGIVDRFNNYQVSAFTTAAHVRLLLLHDKRSEESIRTFFKDVYELYLRAMMNPFFMFSSKIASQDFHAKMEDVLAEYRESKPASRCCGPACCCCGPGGSSIGRCINFSRFCCVAGSALACATSTQATALSELLTMAALYLWLLPRPLVSWAEMQRFEYRLDVRAEDVLALSLLRGGCLFLARAWGGGGLRSRHRIVALSLFFAALSLPFGLVKAAAFWNGPWAGGEHWREALGGASSGIWTWAQRSAFFAGGGFAANPFQRPPSHFPWRQPPHPPISSPSLPDDPPIPARLVVFLVFFAAHALWALAHVAVSRGAAAWAQRRADLGLVGPGYPWEAGEESWLLVGELEGAAAEATARAAWEDAAAAKQKERRSSFSESERAFGWREFWCRIFCLSAAAPARPRSRLRSRGLLVRGAAADAAHPLLLDGPTSGSESDPEAGSGIADSPPEQTPAFRRHSGRRSSPGSSPEEEEFEELVAEGLFASDCLGLTVHYAVCLPRATAVESPRAGETAILLVHGFGGGAFAWRHVAQPLADATGLRVVALDRPGWGLTSRPTPPANPDSAAEGNPYGLPFQARMLLVLCQRLHLDRVLFAGYGDGALLAMLAAEAALEACGCLEPAQPDLAAAAGETLDWLGLPRLSEPLGASELETRASLARVVSLCARGERGCKADVGGAQFHHPSQPWGPPSLPPGQSGEGEGKGEGKDPRKPPPRLPAGWERAEVPSWAAAGHPPEKDRVLPWEASAPSAGAVGSLPSASHASSALPGAPAAGSLGSFRHANLFPAPMSLGSSAAGEAPWQGLPGSMDEGWLGSAGRGSRPGPSLLRSQVLSGGAGGAGVGPRGARGSTVDFEPWTKEPSPSPSPSLAAAPNPPRRASALFQSLHHREEGKERPALPQAQVPQQFDLPPPRAALSPFEGPPQAGAEPEGQLARPLQEASAAASAFPNAPIPNDKPQEPSQNVPPNLAPPPLARPPLKSLSLAPSTLPALHSLGREGLRVPGPPRPVGLALVHADVRGEGAPRYARVLAGSSLGRALLRSVLRAELGEVRNPRAWRDPENLTEEVLRPYRAAQRMRGWEGGAVAVCQARSALAPARRAALFAALATSEVPIAVVAGAEDRVAPVDAARRLALACGPRAELWVLEGAAHLAYEEAPEELVQALASLAARSECLE